MQNVYLIVLALMVFFFWNYLACEGKELGSKLRKRNDGEVFYNNFQELRREDSSLLLYLHYTQNKKKIL